eukprot:TRINITY_DN2863_c0_g1_i1.p1 TRINITY_DN2863_c0_g1~~TRINITY_DN2863_c0_g1_i1.p1  ORF type:complete len:1029 (-),score=217.63 TRINITY_DN2863_c0_g1_i1:718-3804(-)
MASNGQTGWMRGTVKGVTSGDCLLIMGNVKSGPPPEKTITLSSLIAPKLARRDGQDEPFAWAAREFLRKKCIGKEVVFKVDYKVEGIQREFGSVFMGETNLALAVVAEGWARVRTPSAQGPSSPYIRELQALEETAKTNGVGLWTKDPDAQENAIRHLPPSGVGAQEGSAFDAAEVLETNKGQSLPAIVEQVRDGSTVRVVLLPSFQYVQVYLAGIQCPSAGRRAAFGVESAPEGTNGSGAHGNGAADPLAPVDGVPNMSQRLAASNASAGDLAAEPFGLEARHFTEVRCLHRDVRVVLEGLDGRGNNLVGSLHYPDGDTAVNIAPLLVKEGLARVVDWSAESLEPAYKAQLKALELDCKKRKIKMWANFVPPPSNSTAIRDDNFTGTVVEVVSGDCIYVADDAQPIGSPLAERRVNLSSTRTRKLGNPRMGPDQRAEPYAREAKEFLRSRLIGHQVQVSMEYSRKITAGEGREPTLNEGRTMDFGTVMLLGASKQESAESGSVSGGVAASAGGAGGSGMINVAEMAVARGFATVVRHRDFEERSLHYDALLAAEARAIKGKKGMHSGKEPPISHINDLCTPVRENGMSEEEHKRRISSTNEKARRFLPFLQKNRHLPAVVDYVLSGHRFKVIVPREMCAVAFALAGVRCPGRGEPFSEEAIAFMRRQVLQRDVEIEVETVDKTGTFIGSMWTADKRNAGVMLLEAGLARLHPSFAPDRTSEGTLLIAAEEKARNARLKVWHSYVEGQEDAAATSQETGRKAKEEVMEVVVQHVMPGGRFYAVPTSAQLPALEEQLKELSTQDKPVAPGSFAPKKGDRVIAMFSADNSWTRAMVVSTPSANEPLTGTSLYEVFYIDYGNQETVPLSRMRPVQNIALSSRDGLALLCQLAFVRVPGLEDDYGEEAIQFLGEEMVNRKFIAKVEERDVSAPKVKGQGTGVVWHVTCVDAESAAGKPPLSINALILQEGLARVAKRERWEKPDRKSALDVLTEHQEVARKGRFNMWQYGNIDDDDDEPARGGRGGGRGGGR